MELVVDIAWAFQRFGVIGKSLPSLLTEALISCHDEHADAQSMIRSSNKRAYGTVSYTVQERLYEALAGKEGVEYKSPGKGKPKVLVINGTALVQWRYSKSSATDLLMKKYATSDSRVGTFTIPVGATQGMLDLGDGARASLSEEELQLVESLRVLVDSEPREHHRVVVVAYASSSKALHHAVWADAKLNDDGTLLLENVQMLHAADTAEMTESSESKRFDGQPRRDFGLLPKRVSG